MCGMLTCPKPGCVSQLELYWHSRIELPYGSEKPPQTDDVMACRYSLVTVLLALVFSISFPLKSSIVSQIRVQVSAAYPGASQTCTEQTASLELVSDSR